MWTGWADDPGAALGAGHWRALAALSGPGCRRSCRPVDGRIESLPIAGEGMMLRHGMEPPSRLLE